jgi:hypothetical protein
MNDAELNEVLKRTAVPEREVDYWEQFPGGVTAEIKRRARAPRTLPEAGADNAWFWAAVFQSRGAKAAFAFGLAAICIAVGFVLSLRHGQQSPGNGSQLAEARKYYREIEALFPNQVQAIVFDQQGAHLVLAPEPNLPSSPPLYLKICGPKGCQRFVTFSGQQIRVNGDVCDVLTDGQGHVLLVGRQLVWSGAQAAASSGEYQIEARALETSS